MAKLPSLTLFLTSLLTSFGGSFHFGYQMLITGPSQFTFITFLNDSYIHHHNYYAKDFKLTAIWSVIVACFFLGAIVGSVSIGFVKHYFGPKKGLYVSIGCSIIGAVLSIISFYVLSFELYIISRIIIGIAITLSLGLSAIFLNEASDKEYRGAVSMVTGILVQLGTVVGAVLAMSNILGCRNLWWYLYLIEVIIFVAVLLLLPIIPESPAYLLSKGHYCKAREAIIFFNNCDASEAESIVKRIDRSNVLESDNMSLLTILRDKHQRQGIITGCVVAFTACFNGMAVINNYAVKILLSTGLTVEHASYGNIGFCVIMLLSSIVASFIIDKFGRRILMLLSVGAIIILNLIIFAFMISFTKTQMTSLGYCLIAVIMIFLVFNALGSGNLCFFLATELVGPSARGISQTFATLIQMICRAMVLAIFQPLAEVIGTSFAYLILFTPTMVLAFLHLYFNMPETKNLNEQEIINAMDSLPSLKHRFRRSRRNTRL